MAIREERSLIRDTKRLSVVVRSVGFMCVYLFFFLFRGGPGGTLPTGVWFWMRLLIAVTILLFGLASGVSGYTIGAEGAQFDLYRGAPITPGSLFIAKWLAGAVIAVPVALVLSLGLGAWLRGSAGQLALLPFVGLWYALGTTAIAVASSAIGPSFNATQPNRATTPSGRLASAIASAIFLASSFALWGGIGLVVTAAGRIGGFREHEALIAGIACIGALLAAGTVSAVCAIGLQRLRILLAPVP
jgi:hypothetical protein